VWPAIRRLAEAEIRSGREARPDVPIVLEAAVLFEAGWEDAVDEVWVVTVERASAIARAMARDGADAAAVERRIDAQLTNEERRRRADVVIENAGTVNDLERRLDAEWRRVAPARKTEEAR
jgi:dephospho-CoA kinase